jgi:myo-inositol-1(or 4)-monophosphatase
VAAAITMTSEQLLALALSAAKLAGDKLMSGYRSRPRAQSKGAIDFVTEFDLASEAIVLDALKHCGVHIVAEESAATTRIPGADERTFYVDPLDGTTNYLHGHPFFAVSIGLVRGSELLLGVVHAPALGVTWSGLATGPCYRNEEQMRVAEASALNDALLATGFPYDRRTNSDNNLTEYAHIKLLSRGIRRCGSAAIDLALVADGTYDAYWEKRLKPWDLAAGAALVLGAGGTLCNLAGGPHDVRTGDLVAANPLLQKLLVAELGAASGQGKRDERR